MGVPMPVSEQNSRDDEEDRDIWAEEMDDERGKLLQMPLFGDDPPDGEEP